MILVDIIRRFIRSFGIDIVRFHPMRNPLARLSWLLSKHEIDLVVDVGANIGQYGMRMRKLGYRGRIVSFEPLSSAYSSLLRLTKNDPLWECQNVAVGKKCDTGILNVSSNSQSSSLLEMLPTHLASAPDSLYTGSIQVPVTTIDDVLPKYYRPGDKVLLKIDTQGYEQHVLEGSRMSLSIISGIEIEMSIVPLYEGQMNFTNLLSHLQGLGFSLMSLDLGFTNPTNYQLLQVNAILFRL